MRKDNTGYKPMKSFFSEVDHTREWSGIKRKRGNNIVQEKSGKGIEPQYDINMSFFNA